MTNNLENEIREVLAQMDSGENTQKPENEATEEIQDIYVLIVREQEEAEDQVEIVDSTPAVTTQAAPITVQKDTFVSAYLFVCCSLFLIFPTLLFQVYCIVNPPVATITIIPTAKHVQLSGTMQLGRVLPPLTISQSQTTKATGTSHQDARQATGTVTFYNGLFTQQFIASGTVYTGQNGVAIVTTQDATIPPGSPGTGYGTTTVTAQAVTPGTSGNIQAGDIDITINNGLLVRNNQFSGGQDERTFSIVSQQDINKIATQLKISLAQSIQGALQGQLKLDEQLQLLPCSPTVTADHPVGAEATQVKVTVSETCSAIAYNSQELQTKATRYLATQAQQKAGAGYSLFGTVHVSLKQATVSSTATHLVFLSFKATGSWIYGISHQSQEHIRHLIAGKTTQQAQHLLAALPGVAQASMHFSGFGDETRIPKQESTIHLSIIVV